MACRAALLLTFVALLAHAPSAYASTAATADGALTYAAAPGETNSVSIVYDSTLKIYKITDATASPIGSGGCGAVDEHEVDCEDRSISVIVVNLRDGNDKWAGGDIQVVPSVNGGEGDDDLEGIGFLSGGDGDDTIKGLDAGTELDGDGG